jgi:hypothetical protein
LFFMSLLAVEIDENLLMDFRRFAVAKHGRIYRALKPEVELALRNHIVNKVVRAASEEDTHDDL